MSRRTLPPYAAPIKKSRDIGQHPPHITLLLSEEWRELAEPAPCVLVLAQPYVDGAYVPFTWVAGVPVIIINADQAPLLTGRLVAEVAALTAPVWVVNDDVPRMQADEFLWCLRHEVDSREPRWPPYWSDAADAAYVRRERRFFDYRYSHVA